jgi:hypothetical protein
LHLELPAVCSLNCHAEFCCAAFCAGCPFGQKEKCSILASPLPAFGLAS